MLKLNQITKVYEMGETKVEALKGVSLAFRKNEFVSILGQSGCGKTTMLNIIGGLDRYTDGDLVINGISTKEYKDRDWDTYRNHSIGFVFQSYNLIPHQTVLENVELALTLSGVSRKERKKRAIKVLKQVGLGEKLNNKPSQLSGGQMQRVAIARALVNDPEIILADEPTGALDTETSVQIMELLKKISKDKLIIMVTHNPDLAEEYSTRIVRLLDGNVVGDTAPYTEEEEAEEVRQTRELELKQQLKQEKQGITQKEIKKRDKKKKMSFWTALSLSFKNLLTKKARTILVAFAGSIGIIGIALILAVSSGFSSYINKMQEDTLSTYPITIESKKIDFTSVITSMFLDGSASANVDHDNTKVYPKENISGMINSVGTSIGTNNLESFNKYINSHKDELKDYVNAIQYTYDLNSEFVTSNGINVQPNSPAIMNMVIKYSFYYFENDTGIGFTPNPNGTYSLHKPTNREGDGSIEERYPEFFGADGKYNDTTLQNIVRELETNSTGIVEINEDTVLKIVSKILGIDTDLKSLFMGGSGATSVFTKMKTFYEMIDNETLIKSQYDILAGKFPENADEAILVLDENNEVDDYILYALGILSDTDMNKIMQGMVTNEKVQISKNYNDIIGLTYKVLDSVDYYKEIEGSVQNFKSWSASDDEIKKLNYYTYYQESVSACQNTLKIVGVVRVNETTDSGSLSTGVAYTSKFTHQMVGYHNEKVAEMGLADEKQIDLSIPSSISLYINSFDSKEKVKEFIDTYNNGADKEDKITYEDTVDLIMSTVSTIINAITYVLIAFVSVSLIVSSIMIGIITYISVIERTKEIGVLRSVGASKKDIKRVFTAESFIIGLASGLIGIGLSLVLILPINLILKHFTGIGGLAKLPLMGSIVLVLISVALTFIAGLIPAKSAAKKDPVIALREN